jgi:hypothetical protein
MSNTLVMVRERSAQGAEWQCTIHTPQGRAHPLLHPTRTQGAVCSGPAGSASWGHAHNLSYSSRHE